MSEPLLSVRNLSSGYGDFQALFDVSFDLQPKSLLALVGANGAGKSTLFKSILGMLPRDREMIHFKGRPVGDLPTSAFSRLGVALVPEGRRLFRSLSVEENLRICADYGRKGDWTVTRVMELFPILGEKRNIPSQALSGGQQQMVAIGRALVANPEVVLFDEISLGLAPIVVGDVYQAMPEITASGISGILVEQDVTRAKSLADDLICMREGRVVLRGRADDFSQHDLTVAYFGE
ncbi:ABC transporter ATP-binding protein [Celeribacter baekdonensis]|jgi:branched-chain amino acid transport system ATP-binding protein|uniref:ABC transporter ATP-binding protein n=1 Tax=Celeribacter baekdonensis TaxID=875171 RepID=A0A2R4M1P0_9RHOB|nr:ABC transporter ATP-binding protein [Celeribacter baekdonensis]AVW91081.1 ABC transporter ATP-binding protein [Celeribacter baekdonensis]